MVLGTITIQIAFDDQAIKDLVRRQTLTQEQLENIADVLAANLEDPDRWSDDEAVPLERNNFNDSWFDMIEDLQEEFSASFEEVFKMLNDADLSLTFDDNPPKRKSKAQQLRELQQTKEQDDYLSVEEE